MNKVILCGRLGQDPKLTYLPSGMEVCEFTLATDESYKDKDGQKVEQAEWHRVKAFGSLAKVMADYLTKGQQVLLEGRNRTRSWEDQAGQKRYITEVEVKKMEFIGNKSDQTEGQDRAPRASGGSRAPQGRQNSQTRSGGNSGQNYDHGPAFPSDASGMEDVPF
jgi:single-strand DNA-binding protein